MELNLNHYFSKERILDVISHEDKEPYAVSFFEDLYTYPPKIKIQWKQLDLVEESDKLLPNKIINHPPHKSFSGVRDYMDKVISSDVYSKKIKLLKQTLKDVPVYVIVNGRTEIVVASTRSKKLNLHDASVLSAGPLLNPEKRISDLPPNTVTRRQVYKRTLVESVEKALSTKSKKFGFIFFDPIEAQYYLDAMVIRSEKKFHHRRDHSIDKVGLSIHCIGLDTAYSLLSRSSSNVDFRFVPSLPEVKAVLEHSSQGDTNSELAINERQLEQTLSRKALSIISDQYNSAFKGVPIYIVVVKDKFEALQDSEKFKSSSTKTNSSANYIFFDREQALEFCEKYSSRMVSPIYTDNLEDFLELWGESLVLNTDVTQSFININQPTYFYSFQAIY